MRIDQEMKKLILIAVIFGTVILLCSFSYVAQANPGSTFNSDALTRGASDTTAEVNTNDLQVDDNAYYDIGKGKIMEIATNVTKGWSKTTGTINHARLHIIYYTDDTYTTNDYVQYKPAGGSYSDTGIQITNTTTEVSAYWEFPRSAIDAADWSEIEDMSIFLRNTTTGAAKTIHVELLQIVVTHDATFASHDDAARTSPEEDDFNDPGKPRVYMKGAGLEAGLEYKVAYYMSDGSTKVEVDVDTADAGNLLTSDCLITDYYAGVSDETWYAVVFHPSTITAPDTYAEATASENYVIDDSFTVYTSIPEFPTVIAAIAVAGLCSGIYFWMRKRQRGVEFNSKRGILDSDC